MLKSVFCVDLTGFVSLAFEKKLRESEKKIDLHCQRRDKRL